MAKHWAEDLQELDGVKTDQGIDYTVLQNLVKFSKIVAERSDGEIIQIPYWKLKK